MGAARYGGRAFTMHAVAKKRVDALFVAHSVVALVCGVVAVALPHVFEWFLIHHGETLKLVDRDADQKVTHLIIRMYGALILAQVRRAAPSRPRAERAALGEGSPSLAPALACVLHVVAHSS